MLVKSLHAGINEGIYDLTTEHYQQGICLQVKKKNKTKQTNKKNSSKTYTRKQVT